MSPTWTTRALACALLVSTAGCVIFGRPAPPRVPTLSDRDEGTARITPQYAALEVVADIELSVPAVAQNPERIDVNVRGTVAWTGPGTAAPAVITVVLIGAQGERSRQQLPVPPKATQEFMLDGEVPLHCKAGEVCRHALRLRVELEHVDEGDVLVQWATTTSVAFPQLRKELPPGAALTADWR